MGLGVHISYLRHEAMVGLGCYLHFAPNGAWAVVWNCKTEKCTHTGLAALRKCKTGKCKSGEQCRSLGLPGGGRKAAVPLGDTAWSSTSTSTSTLALAGSAGAGSWGEQCRSVGLGAQGAYFELFPVAPRFPAFLLFVSFDVLVFDLACFFSSDDTFQEDFSNVADNTDGGIEVVDLLPHSCRIAIFSYGFFADAVFENVLFLAVMNSVEVVLFVVVQAVSVLCHRT